MDPNVCPVCTLYLREGITLHSHLNTHPKDQVIEALVRCATQGVPSSINSTDNGANGSASELLNTAQTSHEASTTVPQFSNPMQAIPTVPSPGSLSVSSPFGLSSPFQLPNPIPAHNGISASAQGPTHIPSVHPFAIGLGGASSFAYQQFCGAGDGSMGGGPLLLAMTPQQQYAAYSSSSSSSNSLLQMVFNPYAVDPVIGSASYPTPGLITGIGLGPTLQTCQQVQTNVLQHVVTASPIVAAAISSVTPAPSSCEPANKESNSESAQPNVEQEEIITDDSPIDASIGNNRSTSRSLDVEHSAPDLAIQQNAPASSSGVIISEKVPIPRGLGPCIIRVPYRRTTRRGRGRSRSYVKIKQTQPRIINNRISIPSPQDLSMRSAECARENSRNELGNTCSNKNLPPVYNNNDVTDKLLDDSPDPMEKSLYERAKKRLEAMGSSSKAGTYGETSHEEEYKEETEDSKIDDAVEWVDISLFPGDTLAPPAESENRENSSSECFQNNRLECEKGQKSKSGGTNHSKSKEDEAVKLNQWNVALSNSSKEKDKAFASVENRVKETEGNNLKDGENEEVPDKFPGEQPNQLEDTEEKCSVKNLEVNTVADSLPSVIKARTEKQNQSASASVEDDEVVVVGRGENATLEPEKDIRPKSKEAFRENANTSAGGTSARPAPGDSEDALPAPPSPVNIFHIDGMNIIMSSRLIEQTDKVRERLSIFDGFGPIAGSYNDVSIPEGILDEEGLVSDIRADEAMPPRGELSGQEGMVSGSNCSDSGVVNDAVPKPEGSTIWTSGGFSLFPASARQGTTQSDLIPGVGESWSAVEPFKGKTENSSAVVSKTTSKKKSRSKKSSSSGNAEGDGTPKAKAKRLYHCWTCLEVFNCPKERRVHQREKHSGVKEVTETPPVESTPQSAQLVDQADLGIDTEKKVKTEVKQETTIKTKEPVQGKIKVSKVEGKIRKDGSKLVKTENTKCSHACSECDRSFPSLRSLTAHQTAAHRESRFKCPTCSEKFLTSADFTNHIRTVHPLECSLCGKQFLRQQNLRLHLKRHMSVRPYKCTQCDKAFVTNQKMEEHLNSHTGRTPFQCPLCPRAFRRHSNLIQHRKHHHMKVKRKVKDFFCHCGAVFHSVKKLDWHKETHDDKPKTCPHCSDRFVHKAGLTRHIRQVHDRRYVPSGAREEVNVECPVCSAVYLKSSLHIHMRVHSGERPFSCGICGKGFATKWNLQLHRWVHASPHSKPFKCPTCKAAYHRRVDYLAHVRSHRKVRPFVCNTCGRRFMRKYNCIRHSREHETGKAFECTVCHKRFHRRYYLKEHLRIHTGLRPYICHVCGKASGTKSNMNKHVRIHHAREPVNTEG